MLNRDNISSDTALHLAEVMQKCKGLIYIHSPNSTLSKWCPWELGYFSGYRKFMCSYLPLLENSNDKFPKQEYLSIYPIVEFAKTSVGNRDEFWIKNEGGKYTTLRLWLETLKP